MFCFFFCFFLLLFFFVDVVVFFVCFFCCCCFFVVVFFVQQNVPDTTLNKYQSFSGRLSSYDIKLISNTGTPVDIINRHLSEFTTCKLLMKV